VPFGTFLRSIRFRIAMFEIVIHSRDAMKGNHLAHPQLLPVGVPHVVIIKLSSVSLALERTLADTLLNSDQCLQDFPHPLSSALDKFKAEPEKASRHMRLPDETCPPQE